MQVIRQFPWVSRSESPQSPSRHSQPSFTPPGENASGAFFELGKRDRFG